MTIKYLGLDQISMRLRAILFTGENMKRFLIVFVCLLSYNINEVIYVDARVDSRIPTDIKEKASKELADHGLSISTYIRMVLTSVANDGLPKYWGIPNTETMASINEVADDLIGIGSRSDLF